MKQRLTQVGSFVLLDGLLVDQARVWADPQATRLIFLPWSDITSLGLWNTLTYFEKLELKKHVSEDIIFET